MAIHRFSLDGVAVIDRTDGQNTSVDLPAETIEIDAGEDDDGDAFRTPDEMLLDRLAVWACNRAGVALLGEEFPEDSVDSADLMDDSDREAGALYVVDLLLDPKLADAVGLQDGESLYVSVRVKKEV